MKRFKLAPAAALFILLAPVSCKNTREIADVVEPASQTQLLAVSDDPDAYVDGKINIYVSEEFAAQIEAATMEDGRVDVSAVKAMGFAVKDLGIVKMKRLFPYAGKFEARTRAEGMHRWYAIDFDEQRPLTKAGNDLSDIPGIDKVEFEPRLEIVGDRVVTQSVDMPVITAASSTTYPFNDPKLSEQWHYYNNGSGNTAQSGCDVNVFPVWERYTAGSPDVIVAVVDEGVDYNHEDLADNMWHNPEKSGNFQYGYNFCTDNFTINPGDHGTHVAGTVAAVNNNGKGVCGIAGGNFAKNQKGARIMSCQIFDGNKDGSGASAIKWAADHGAVIAQNSWGITVACSTSDGLKQAVDYFIKYAGMDENGKQTGPMAGGLVVFAAGNNNSQEPYGVDYEKMLIVTSVGADYMRAYYSNYGPWCHIAAPGGDAKKGNQILSTMVGNKYGYLQGTSMACPHVSGVAALVLSKQKAQGYTSAALRSALENNVTDISAFTRSAYLGKGLVNAYKAIASGGGKAPDKVTDLTATANSNNINFSLRIPSDSDDGKPNSIMVYYSTGSLTSLANAMFVNAYVENGKAGDMLTGTIIGLDFNQQYNLCAVACDVAGNKSAKSDIVRVKTGGNNPPRIETQSPLEYVLKPHEKAIVNTTIVEPDNHFVTINLKKGCDKAESLDTLERLKPKIVISAVSAPTGTYMTTLEVTDFYGLTTTLDVRYTVLENHRPEIVGQIPDQVLSVKGTKIELKESDFFKDEDGEQLSYKIENDNENVANVNYNKGIIYITALGTGYANVKVNATDARGETVSQTFRILMRESSDPVDIYPNPVSDVLYVRTSEAASAELKILNSTGAAVASETIAISPFNPAKVDMKKYPGGLYTVVVDYDGHRISRTVVKL